MTASPRQTAVWRISEIRRWLSARLKSRVVPLQARAPRPAYFDAKRRAWMLSRYADVVAASRELFLWPSGTTGEDRSADRNEHGELVFRKDFQHALSPANVASWQSQAQDAARALLGQMPEGQSFDLVSDFAEPLCFTLAMKLMKVNSADQQRLTTLVAQIFNRVDSGGTVREDQANTASAELGDFFRGSPVPRGDQTFIGMSKTLPRLMANGWVALLWHSDQLALLRAQPRLMHRAVEELMRYAPTVHMISRRAMADVELNGVRINRGAQVNLMLASANRDPEQFPHPDRLDVSRHARSQVSLGIDRHSCAGATVVRMVYAVTTAALLEAFREIVPAQGIQWRRSQESCWPVGVWVTCKRRLAD